MTRLWHLILAATALLPLLYDARQRRLFAEMQAFLQHLPQVLNRPLPEALALMATPQVSKSESSMERGIPALEDQTGTPVPLRISFSQAGVESGLLSEAAIRRLADTSALLDRSSPLGSCLRRSMVRYHFLRRAGIPVVVQFGARFKDGQPDREVTGHAWLTLGGRPYFEAGDNYENFTIMLQYP